METTTQNLWPDFVLEKTRSPKSILKEQAGYLMAKTNNILSAEVRTRQEQGRFYQSFYVVAPALNNYRYELFSLIHPATLYPLTITDNEFPVPASVDNEEQLLESIADIFKQPKTIRIISSLVSQSLEE